MDDDKELTDLDRALADALDVDVSADFAARVRRRIADEPAPSRWRWAWRFAAPAAAAVAVLAVAVASVWRPADRRAPQPLAPQTLARAAAAPAPRSSSPPVRAMDRPPVRATDRPHQPRPVATRASAEARAEPEVLVPREEIEMYRRLMANAQNVPGAFVVAAPPDIVAVQSIAEIPIDPIRIDLIVPSVDGEGDRQ